MWDFLRPTRLKLWIALAWWISHWLVDKIGQAFATPLAHKFYPGYFSRLMETMQQQDPATLMRFATDADSIGISNLFFAVDVAVATVVGYLGACLIVLLAKHAKSL